MRAFLKEVIGWDEQDIERAADIAMEADISYSRLKTCTYEKNIREIDIVAAVYEIIMRDAAIELQSLYDINIFDIGIRVHRNFRDSQYDQFQLLSDRIYELHNTRDQSNLYSETLKYFLKAIRV